MINPDGVKAQIEGNIESFIDEMATMVRQDGRFVCACLPARSIPSLPHDRGHAVGDLVLAVPAANDLVH